MPTQQALEQAAREAWPDDDEAQKFGIGLTEALGSFGRGPLLALARRIEAQQADEGMVERVARAICQSRDINPDCLYQHNFEGDYPEDERREFTDAITGEPRVQLFHRAWRHSEKAARAALAAVKPDDGWQPIETAPKDGTEFLAWAFLHDDGGAYHADGSSFMGETAHYHILRWEDGCGWVSPYAGSISGPVAWRPLPTPPAIAAVKEG